MYRGFQGRPCRRRGANGGNDALTDSGDDGFLCGTTHKALEVGADGDSGACVNRDAVFGDRGDFGDPWQDWGNR